MSIQEVQNEGLSLQLCQRCQESIERSKMKDYFQAKVSVPRSSDRVNRVLKALRPEEQFVFPDGAVVSGSDVVEQPRPGRKVAILGDTANSQRIAGIAQGADLLVHEATNAWMGRSRDDPQYTAQNKLERETIHHGHSTPEMAGRFARQIGAKRLALTHFSSRYCGEDTEFSMRLMWHIEDKARRAKHGATRTGSDVTGESPISQHSASPHNGNVETSNEVVAAWDQLTLNVPIQETAPMAAA